jgi:tetratricopeptide (TPR) repeat protein
MASFVPLSGQTYLEYLQENAYVKDVNDNIRQVSEKAVEKLSDNLSLSLVATSEQLAHSFSQSIETMNNSMDYGMSIMTERLSGIEYAIEELNSKFDYSLSLVIHQLEIANKLNRRLVDKLDAIHNTLKNPVYTQAREYYRMGCDRLSKGLLDKALDSFLKSREFNDVDFFTEFNIGKLYLYGLDEDDNVIDLDKAEKHLLTAIRFGKAELNQDIGFKKFTSEAFLHLAFCYLAKLGNLIGTSGKVDNNDFINVSNKQLFEAVNLNPGMSIAYYQLSSNYSLLNDVKNSISYLNQAINLDRNYAAKVAIDKNFDGIRKQIDSFISEKTEVYKEKVSELQARIEKHLSYYISWQVPKHEIELIQLTFENAIKSAKTLTYFGQINAYDIMSALEVNILEKTNNRISLLIGEAEKKYSEVQNKYLKLKASDKSSEIFLNMINRNIKNGIEEFNSRNNEKVFNSFMRLDKIHNDFDTLQKHSDILIRYNNAIKNASVRHSTFSELLEIILGVLWKLAKAALTSAIAGYFLSLIIVVIFGLKDSWDLYGNVFVILTVICVLILMKYGDGNGNFDDIGIFFNGFKWNKENDIEKEASLVELNKSQNYLEKNSA